MYIGLFHFRALCTFRGIIFRLSCKWSISTKASRPAERGNVICRSVWENIHIHEVSPTNIKGFFKRRCKYPILSVKPQKNWMSLTRGEKNRVNQAKGLTVVIYTLSFGFLRGRNVDVTNILSNYDRVITNRKTYHFILVSDIRLASSELQRSVETRMSWTILEPSV